MHRSYLASVEMVSIDNVDRLAIALGIDPQALLSES
jgi:hypothetical protein